MDSVRPPEQRAVRGLLAFRCWPMQPHRRQGYVAQVVDGAAGLHKREQRKPRRAHHVAGELAPVRGSAWTACGRLSSELYAVCSRSALAPCNRIAVKDTWLRWLMGGRGCTSGSNAS